MKECESCGKQHEGTYGSGRFCSAACARSFSTKSRREEINKRVSEKMKGQPTSGKPFRPGYDPRRKLFTLKERQLGAEARERIREAKYKEAPFEELSIPLKRRKIFEEQDGECNHCRLLLWNGVPIKLELHHKDGNNKNNSRDNLELLCPNCHSFTDNWRTH